MLIILVFIHKLKQHMKKNLECIFSLWKNRLFDDGSEIKIIRREGAKANTIVVVNPNEKLNLFIGEW